MPVRFSGTVGAAASRSLDGAPDGAEDPRTVDAVLAVPFDNKLGQFELRNGVWADVREDGSFNVTVGSLYQNTVLMLLDSTAPLHESVVGYAALSDVDESLISFPATNTGMGVDVDLGNLMLDGTEAISDRALSEFTVDFDLPIAELRSRARLDDVLKRMKNVYVNDHGERHWESSVVYMWQGDLTGAVNQPGDPSSFAFTGVNLQISAHGYADLFTFDDLYEQRKIMTITAPAPVLAGGETSPRQVFSNAGDVGQIEIREVAGQDLQSRSAGADGFYFGEEREGVTDITPALGFALPIPQGLWEVDLDGEAIAHFDVAVGSPFDDAGNPIAPMPAIEITTNDQGRVTGISAHFYEYLRGEDGYRQITEQVVIDQFLGFGEFVLMPEDGRLLGGLSMSYVMFGVNCFFDLRMPGQ